MKNAFVVILILIFSAPTFAEIGKIISTFPVPGNYPTGLATDGKYLYMADRKSHKIYTLNPESGKTIDEFEAPGYRPYGLAYDGRAFWLVDGEENVVIQIDPRTKTNLMLIPLPTANPSGLAWDGKYLWVSESEGNKLYQISPEDGTTIKELPSPSGNATGLSFDGTYLWVADRNADRIWAVWPATGEVVITLKSPGQYPWGLACIGDKLYCADYQTDSIYVLATDDNEITIAKDKVGETMEYTHQIRNYGPGEILGLDIYLAIPDNSPHQTIASPPVFTPAQYEILSDKWGQQVARFHFDTINAGQMASASYKLTADIYDQWFIFHPEKVGQLKDIPRDIKDKFLIDDAKFAIKSPTIQNAVKTAVGGENNPYWMMRKIFGYIIDHLEYELAYGWNVAPTVLDMGRGSCSEYSFVFIAMCRAAGLPARYTGAITQRGDLASEDDTFHRWCEVYLPNIGWVPVDPSGGDSNSPSGQANAIGHVSNRYLITTTGGGGSDYLGWEYNSYSTWRSKGICKIYEEKLGDWSPAVGSEEGKPDSITIPGVCKPK